MHDVLVLNKSWLPTQITRYQRAVKLLFLDHAHALDKEWFTPHSYLEWLKYSRHNSQNHRCVYAIGLKIAVPEIIVLTRYNSLPNYDVKYNRDNVLKRDKCICQYCGIKLTADQLQIEHVIPRAQGGKTTWENVVVTCHPCNHKKGNKTPEQAGMKLLKKPKQPRWVSPLFGDTIKNHPCKSWHKYLEKMRENFIV